MDRIELAQVIDRWRVLVKAVLKLRVPLNAENFLIGRKKVSFLRWTLLHGVSTLPAEILSSAYNQCKINH